MTARRRWLRGDALAIVVVVVAIGVALLARGWRGAPRPLIVSGSAAIDTTPIDMDRAPVGIIGARPHHSSPFNDSVTTRAESRCVEQIQSQLAFQLKEPVVVTVNDRYGVGDRETGAGDSLDIDGVARTQSGRISAWHCGMANLGAYPGSPMVTHVEGK